jgi:hypothetical protein
LAFLTGMPSILEVSHSFLHQGSKNLKIHSGTMSLAKTIKRKRTLKSIAELLKVI